MLVSSNAQYSPLLMWFSNATRVTAYAGLSTQQSVRCITNHLTGAAQRLFLEQLAGQPLASLSVSALGVRLMTMIPEHETLFSQEVQDIKFDKHSLFECLKRFELPWQYSHLDSGNVSMCMQC